MAREPTSQITSSRAELRAKILRANFEPSHYRAKDFRAGSEPSFSELFSSYTNEPSRTEPSLARSHPYFTASFKPSISRMYLSTFIHFSSQLHPIITSMKSNSHIQYYSFTFTSLNISIIQVTLIYSNMTSSQY